MNSQVGIISNWNDEKGFGFIASKSGGSSIFIHINEYSKKHKRPISGLSVQYSVAEDKKGRKCAVNVYPVEGHKKYNGPHNLNQLLSDIRDVKSRVQI